MYQVNQSKILCKERMLFPELIMKLMFLFNKNFLALIAFDWRTILSLSKRKEVGNFANHSTELKAHHQEYLAKN